MPRIYMTVSAELQKLITRYAKEFDISESRAAAELAAIGANVQFNEEIPVAVAPHGGRREGAGRKDLDALIEYADKITDFGRNDPSESELWDE